MKKGMKMVLILIIVLVLMLLIFFGINLFVILKEKNKIIGKSEIENLKDIDCILVLGAGVINQKPSHMLEDRLLEGINLYKNNVSKKIVMSGDHGQKNYDEVNIMKQFAIDKGVVSSDIFMDHAGFSTYDSMYRIKEVFCAKKIVIVTQKYHLYRALYIAENLGLEAYGVASNPRKYRGQIMRELREIGARDKDVFKCITKPESKYLGDVIPVNGDGDVTNDK